MKGEGAPTPHYAVPLRVSQFAGSGRNHCAPRLGAGRWWTIEEIDTTNERILPALLGDVARLVTQGTIGPSPIELRWVNFDRIEIDPSTGDTKD